jgi:hypothetical protein
VITSRSGAGRSRAAAPGRPARAATPRRAPRFGAFVATGAVIGAALGGFLGEIAPEGLLENHTPAILMSALGLGGLGALAAAGLAAWADKRSGRRPPAK